MECQIKVHFDKDLAKVTVVGTCDKAAYHLMYEAISCVMRYCERMKYTVTHEEVSANSIKKTLVFKHPESAQTFYNRLPKTKG